MTPTADEEARWDLAHALEETQAALDHLERACAGLWASGLVAGDRHSLGAISHRLQEASRATRLLAEDEDEGEATVAAGAAAEPAEAERAERGDEASAEVAEPGAEGPSDAGAYSGGGTGDRDWGDEEESGGGVGDRSW